MSGKLFVIEGLDGSGKATQAERFFQKLEHDGRNPVKLSFPRYDDDSSVLVRGYLAGEYGQNPEDVGAFAASLFFAIDRYVSFKKDWGEKYADGGIFVSDRYTTSNAVYQMSKLPETEWDAFLSWLSDLEYTKLAIPSPDLVIYLDIPVRDSAKLMLERYGGDKSKMDIHERDIRYQEKSRRAALYCAGLYGWNVINCFDGGKMRPKEEIAAEIYLIAEKDGLLDIC